MGEKILSTDAASNACDCHIHIFDNRFIKHNAAVQTPKISGTVESYREVQRRLGTQRVVVVTPRIYDTDNSVTVDAISKFGEENARGVAVLRPDVTDAQLETLHEKGIRGVRFTLYNVHGAPTKIDMVHVLADRIKPLGWHIQVHLSADQVVDYKRILMTVSTPVVFDHFGRLPVNGGLSHPSRRIIEELLAKGRGWIKLSAPYMDSQIGKHGEFADIDHIAKFWLKTAPHAVLWGSDWPHTVAIDRPEPTLLLRRLDMWVDDAQMRRHVLISNPAKLYGFSDCLE